ncbi:MAG: transporter ATP-binding protein [Modestobacter sp.]|jgi:ABC-type branched-subunit amino acid transport system ATPase component|nr:transporter ATP-binding protein [Modestobacter sp.]
MSGTAVLEARGISRSFGGVHAVREVSLTVAEGERRLVIGPNGAGKSVFFSLLGGQYTPDSGAILLGGEEVTSLSPHRRARRGLARTFQLNSLFPDLTVRENVRLAVQAATGTRWSVRSHGRGSRLQERTDELLAQWRLEGRADQTIALLSYGERRRLEVILALAGHPRVLLLDEPTAGLTPEESVEMLEVVLALPSDVAIVMIEHDMSIANRFAERITVLAMGEVVADGPPEEVRQNPLVRQSYLGEE